MFGVVLALFFASAALATAWPALRSRILLWASLLQLVILHKPVAAAGALGIWSVFHFMMQPRWSLWIRIPILAGLYVAPWLLARAMPGSVVLGIVLVAHMSTNLAYRAMLYAYEASAKRRLLQGAGYPGFLLYMTALPLGAFQAPPIGWAVMHQRLRTEADAELMKRGILQMGLGAIYLVLNRLGREHGLLLRHSEVLGAVEELNVLTMVAAANLLMIGLFLELIGQVHLAIGMLRVLGFDIGPGSDRPLLARNVLEFWRRWNIYYRDFLLTLGYYPVVNPLRRRPYLAVALGGAVTFLLSGFVHAVMEYMGNPARLGLFRFLEPHIEMGMLGLFVVVWMLKEAASARRWRSARRKGPPEGSPPWARVREAGSVACTLTVIGLIYTIFRRPFSGLMTEFLQALARPPW